MTVTTLDPRVALLVIDLQKGIVALPTVHPAAEVTGRAAELATAFREHGLPVVLVNVTGGAPGRTDRGASNAAPAPDWAELAPELNAQHDDFRVTKERWGAFHDTPLHDHLKDLGVTQVVLAGIATSIGVESTARAAHERGYNVTVAIDAITDMNPVAHDNSVANIFPSLGETGSTDEILEILRATR